MKLQRGYLLEIPLILIITGLLLSILIPILPPIATKILVTIGAIIFIGGFYYMIIIPGWQPNSPRFGYWWKFVLFGFISVIIILIIFLYVIS